MVGSNAAYVKKMYKAFCGTRGSGTKSDKVPHVMSLKSALIGAEDYKFENEINLREWS